MGIIDTDEFYRDSCAANFVKVADIARNKAWTTQTTWGDLQITINLSKPEKDPRAIAAAAAQQARDVYVDPATGFERPCPLCVTQADVDCGYARVIPIGGERWGMWYSPYAYYNEHCIAMSWQHRPMHIDRAAFTCLFDFVDLFPTYFIGSNADLPIVGGSILSHDHFQGGRHTFPMGQAPLSETFDLPSFPHVEAGIVKWPLSVIRLRSAHRAQLLDAACAVLDAWCVYDDPAVGIVSGMCKRGQTPFTHFASAQGDCAEISSGDLVGPRASEGNLQKVHNTITPIVRKNGADYEMDLALRCNITSDEHPLGVFHPHEELHHIKKENIGLIEVMGLAILPPRVLQVMEDRNLSRDDVGQLFARVLEHAGVFKWDDEGRRALHRFIDCVRAR